MGVLSPYGASWVCHILKKFRMTDTVLFILSNDILMLSGFLSNLGKQEDSYYDIT